MVKKTQYDWKKNSHLTYKEMKLRSNERRISGEMKNRKNTLDKELKAGLGSAYLLPDRFQLYSDIGQHLSNALCIDFVFIILT